MPKLLKYKLYKQTFLVAKCSNLDTTMGINIFPLPKWSILDIFEPLTQQMDQLWVEFLFIHLT